ncbi:hypothetical protein [Faecalibacter bovis]|uniref:Uncharacterized protein n=1 Tax=Faecalibacter bovis TaxID=2898187 RepID=A0ABX7XAC0_9FLAO|nr:hypothetical protein [Faecalibacter bovis]QTV04837.1 hypothetical protein J9309_08500 [Faecalibacter bovis]
MKLNFVVYGKNNDIIETLVRIINKNQNWHALCIDNQSDLKNHILSHSTNILLFSSNIGKTETEEIEMWTTKNFPSVKQIHHYGGGGGLLNSEIQSALLGLTLIEKPALNCIL